MNNLFNQTVPLTLKLGKVILQSFIKVTRFSFNEAQTQIRPCFMTFFFPFSLLTLYPKLGRMQSPEASTIPPSFSIV